MTEIPPANSTAAEPPAATGGVRRPLWRRPWLGWTLGTTLALVAAALLFVTYALPGIVIEQAERIVGEKFHRTLTIGSLQIHPWSLALSVGQLRLLEADGKTVFASIESLELQLAPASLVQRAPVVRALHVGGPYLHLARTAANHYSTDDLLAALSAGPPPPPDAPPARFSINNIRIDGGRFVFDDLPRGARHEVGELTLGLPFVSNFAADEQITVEPQLSARVDGAPLRIGGRARPFASTRTAAVDLDVDGVDLTRYLDYLPGPLPLRLPSARLDLHLKLAATLAPQQAPNLGVSGTVRLSALDLRAADGRPLLQLGQLELALEQANYPAGALDLRLNVEGRGRLAARGTLAAAPLHADLALQIDDLDLLPLQPLFADRVNLRVTHATLAAKGHLVLDQPGSGPLQGNFAGDVRLAHLATIDSLNHNDFVNWDALSLRGIGLQLAPLALHIDEVALDKLFARVIINPGGRINLQDIVKQKAQPAISLTEASTAPVPAAPASAPVPAAGPAGPPITVGRVLLRDGHVRFTDNFVQPRYGADLLELNGAVEGLSSDPASTASIDVRGRVNDAPLLIGGRVNPLSRELALDIKASVHDMELAPLSAYSGKYVGYRIERGKLSFDVAYQLKDRQLQAKNRLVLDQLTFGDKVESPSAVSLPVQLAVALLKDRNGVIDIDLPIGGSLDDPDFSVGGIIVKVLLNLVTKAVTAPFALLGNLFGGGTEQMSSVAFDPGRAVVTPERESGLKALAKAMTERPGLKLDITGWADPATDTEALRALGVDARLRALKRQDLAERGTLGNPAEVVVTAAEYPGLLARAYALDVAAPAAAGAPAGAAAAAKPAAPAVAPDPAQMEQALRARQNVTEKELRTLGNRRAQAAKDWLRTIGLVPEERLSLVDAHLAAPGDAASGARVEFGLR